MRFLSFLIIISLLKIVASCSETEEKQETQIQPTARETEKKEVKPVAEYDNSVKKMLELANYYDLDGRPDKALVLYKHVCTLKHDLPGVFLYTGILCALKRDTVSARNYFQLEIKQDNRLLKEKLHDEKAVLQALSDAKDLLAGKAAVSYHHWKM
jgi:hypothetical protein